MSKRIKMIALALLAMLSVSACAQTPEELMSQGYQYNKDGNYAKAIECYMKASEKGRGDASSKIGVMYWLGDGVKKNEKKAAEWFKKGAEQGDSSAQDKLGFCYENGFGVEKDVDKAIYWYQKAAEQGHEGAKEALKTFDLYVVEGSNGKKGCAYKNGQLIIPYEYDDIEADWRDNEKVILSEGLIAVAIEAKENKSDKFGFDKWGFIDKKNNVVIPIVYERVGLFKNGMVWADDKIIDKNNSIVYERAHPGKAGNWQYMIVRKNGKYGFLDADDYQRIVIPIEYENVGDSYENGWIEVKKNGNWGIIDKSNRVVIPFEYEEIDVLSDDHIDVKKNGNWGVVDTNNQIVIPFEYENIHAFSEGLAAAKKNGKWGFIDIVNKTIIPFEYDGVYSSFNNGYAQVERNDKRYVISKTNTIIYELGLNEYGIVMKGDDGVMMYLKGENIGYIDRDYKVMIPAEYNGAKVYKSGCAIVRKNGKWGVVDKTNSIMIPFEYEELWTKGEGFTAKKNGKWGKIDKNNKVVVPFIYDDEKDVK